MSVNPNPPLESFDPSDQHKTWIKEWQKCQNSELTNCLHYFKEEGDKNEIDSDNFGELNRLGKYYLDVSKWNKFKDSMDYFKIHLSISDEDPPGNTPYFRPILQPFPPDNENGGPKYYCFDWQDKNPGSSFSSEVPYDFKQNLVNNWNNLYPGYIADIFESRERKFAEPNFPKDSINAPKDRGLLPRSILRGRVKFYRFDSDIERMKDLKPSKIIFHMTVNLNYENEERPTFVPILEFQERSHENSNGGRIYFEYSAPCPPRCQR